MDTESLTQLEQIVTRAATTLKAALRQDIESSAADIKRHTGVLVEGLRHDLQLLAEVFRPILINATQRIENTSKTNSKKPGP